jgi:cytochrome c oxidase assembly protein subunit 15
MSDPLNHPGLHRFAVLTAAVTLLLLGAGGLVTSHGVGMAVPDWPNTYGYNLFFFPVSRWVGGIFYEHTHRLIAAGVGLMTGVVALWLHGRRARRFMRWAGGVLVLVGIASVLLRPVRWEDGLVSGVTGLVLLGAGFIWPRCEPASGWLRRLGLVAFVAVVLQGVLGGLRVVWFKDQLGIVHATLAQLFFVLTCAIALFTSRWWGAFSIINPHHGTMNPGGTHCGASRPSSSSALPGSWAGPAPAVWLAPAGGSGAGSPPSPGFGEPRETGAPRLRGLFLFGTLLILFQLMLGATMRHQHAGLAIPDFPLAYGRVWPATDPDSVARYNEQRVEVTAANPITAFQIHLQMAHRLVAVLILAGVGLGAWRARRAAADGTSISTGLKAINRLAAAWFGLVLVQAALGAFTVWSNKAADIATAHVLAGALSLATGAVLCLLSFRCPECARQTFWSSETATGAENPGLSGRCAAAVQHP